MTLHRVRVTRPLATTRERVSHERPCNHRASDHTWQQPVDNGRKLLPNRQVPAIVDIERNYQKHVGRAHAAYMYSGPPTPAPTASRTAQRRCHEGKQSEYEQVVVLFPAHRGEDSRGNEDCAEEPIVDRARRWVTASRLFAQHRDGAAYDADQCDRYVQTDDREKERGVARNDDASDRDFTAGHGNIRVRYH